MFDTVLDVGVSDADALYDEDWFDPAWLEQVPAPEDVGQIPAARSAPSGWLALELDHGTVDPAALSDAELIDTIVGFDRVASWASARQAGLLAEFARRRPRDDSQPIRSDVPSRCSELAPDEVGLALRLSRNAAANRLVMAQVVVVDLPGTLAAWQAGTLDVLKVRAIAETSYLLPAEQRGALEARVLPRAGTQTVSQLRAALARALLVIDPDGAAFRHEQRRADRRVALSPDSDGMATLWALLSAPDATAAYQRLCQLARDLGAGDPRGMDARRADLLVELLTGRRCAATAVPVDDGCSHPDSPLGCDCTPAATTPAAAGAEAGLLRAAPALEDPVLEDPVLEDPVAGLGGHERSVVRRAGQPGKPLVSVIVPITTLMGLDDQPGELAGYGPIPATLAREIAADGTWRRLLTDPASGVLLDYGRTTYTPPAGLADFVRARDLYCRNPICGQPAATADLDHTIAWADGGHTSHNNLHAACRHDHLTKTFAPGWHVDQHPDGRITWTTPTGHTYTSHPHDYRPDPHPPPRSDARTPDPATDTTAGTGHEPPEDDDPPF